MNFDPFINIDLGPCCACGCEGNCVRNLQCLPEKAPIPGTGWGCVVCGLPADGAMAVICDTCLVNQVEIRYAIVGYATGKQRIERKLLQELHEHNLKLHQQEEKREAWRRRVKAAASPEQRTSGNGHKPEAIKIRHYQKNTQKKHR